MPDDVQANAVRLQQVAGYGVRTSSGDDATHSCSQKPSRPSLAMRIRLATSSSDRLKFSIAKPYTVTHLMSSLKQISRTYARESGASARVVGVVLRV